MRQAEAGAERVGDGVAGGGVDRAEADAAVEGGEQHAGAGLGVLAVGDGAGEVAADQIDAHAGVGVDQRVGLAVGEGLDAMGERVDAGGGGDRARHARW